MRILIKTFFIISIASVVYACCRKPVTAVQGVSISQDIGKNSNLLNQSWKLIEINNISVQSDAEIRTPYMILKQGSREISGNAGCNSFSGVYSLEGPTLQFGNFIATKMACDQLELEYQFLSMLKQCERFQIVADTLTLSDAQDRKIARFIAFSK